ncbi:DUF3027 domain-containing protein [Mycolicibacterium vinylchloridicum]|uniref:DUF3027 domain-containing protein n=1 Tax=Mycolicibacterium vinylchloridicum TaxID=2736928 RepID=UPI0038993F6A
MVTMDSSIDSAEATASAQPGVPSDAAAAVLSGAVEQARQAIVEFSGDTVGEYLGVSFEDESAATHRFLAKMTGYQGWQWAVVVAACPGADHATVSEVVLVPGPTALLAPAWVPWEERVKPGDLSPGDLLAPVKDDPRLVPGYTGTGDPAIDDVAYEVGFGRRQVLSALGRDDAAQRWHDGDHGPGAPMARGTKRVCRDCGFMVPLSGALGVMFGVCCNEMSADAHVVDFEYGCGAHSDTPAPPGSGSPMYDPYDDGVLEVVEIPTVEPPAIAEAPEPAEADEAPELAENSETAEQT